MAGQSQSYGAEPNTPDKQAMLSVLKYLKTQISKETQDSLKKELGIQSDSELEELVSTIPTESATSQGSDTEPAKYEESYSRQEGTPISLSPSSLPSTRADFQPTLPTDHFSSTATQEHSRLSSRKDGGRIAPAADATPPQTAAVRPITSTIFSSSSLWAPPPLRATPAPISQTNRSFVKVAHKTRPSSIDSIPLWGKPIPRLSAACSTTPPTGTVVATSATSGPAGAGLPISTPFIYQIAMPTQGGIGSVQPSVLSSVLTVLPTGLLGAATRGVSSHQIILSPTQAFSASSSLPVFQPGQCPVSSTMQDAGETPGSLGVEITGEKGEPQRSPFDSVSSFSDQRHYPEPSTGQAMAASPFSDSSQCIGPNSPPRTLASVPLSEMTPLFNELKVFAEEFKTKRIRLGYTQGAVGQSLSDKGYSNFAQSTISRFEQMQLSPTNAASIKIVLERWLMDAENPSSVPSSSSLSAGVTSRKRKKRAVFTPHTRTTLEEFFQQNPRPNRQLIEAIATRLDLLPEEVRVWFCNKRQKEKNGSYSLGASLGSCERTFSGSYEHTLSTSSSGEASPLRPPELKRKRDSPSPRMGFSIEELSKSSTSSSVTSSPPPLTSPPLALSPLPASFPTLLVPSTPSLMRFSPRFSVTQANA